MSAFGNSPLVLGGNSLSVPSGSSPVGGPASSTDNALVRWDGTGGNLVQNSPVTLSDGGVYLLSQALAIGTTAANYLSLINTTAAAAGAQQYGPSFEQQGRGWKTDATAASQSVGFRRTVVPVEGAAAPTGNLLWESNINGTYATLLTLKSAGTLQIGASSATRLLLGTPTDSANGALQLATHTTSAGGIGLGTETAIFRVGAGVIGLAHIGGSNPIFNFYEGVTSSASIQTAVGTMRITALTAGASMVLRTTTGGGSTVEAVTLDSSQFLLKSTGTNGQSLNIKHLTELTTIAAAATTSTTIQIPANCIVVGVSARVTVVVPTAATFDYGVSGATTRYGTGISTAATTTHPGMNDGTRFYGSAVSILITPNLTPADNSGRIRFTIAYLDTTVPTS